MERANQTASRLQRTVLRAAAYAVVLVLLTFYLVQHSRIAPNATDGGLHLTYIQDMVDGLRPHRDFVDAYGPLNWPMAVILYEMAGNKQWGIRIWLVILKLIIIFSSFGLVRRLAGTFYAVVTVIWMTLLYGMPWQSLQTNYGFNNVIPFILGAWYFLLCQPFARAWVNIAVSALFGVMCLWIKVNAGLYVVAGGLFYCFYWLPVPEGQTVRTRSSAVVRAFQAARAAGLAVYLLLFYVYVERYFNVWYFAYLIGPLAIGLIWTAYHLWLKRTEPTPVDHYLGAWGVYLGVTVTSWALFLLVYTGSFTESVRYVDDQARIFLNVDYMLPFSQLGVGEEYIGFNENYWLQLPWLFTLTFVAWMYLQQGGRGQAAFGRSWPVAQAQATGLYMMLTLYAFVIYSRADETHVFQALMVMPPALFVLLYQLEALCLRSRERRSRIFRSAVFVAALSWGMTIVTIPDFSVFNLEDGEYRHPKLQYIRYRKLYSPFMRDFSADISDHEWDKVTEDAAMYIDKVTKDGEPILVFDANRILHALSNTRPPGGRYHYYFYLLGTNLFNAEGFRKAVPPSVLQEILANPPKVAVGTIDRVPPIANALPELRRLVYERYRVTEKFRHMVIYERID